MTTTPTIGVVGATGTLGQRVVASLEQRHLPARLIVRRNGAPVSDMHRRVFGDLDQPDGLATAFSGLDLLILITAESPRQAAQGIAAIDAARNAGVRRVVLVSAFLAAGTELTHFGGQHARIEQALAQSGLDHVILRPSFFMQSLFLLKRDIAKGRLIVPVPTGKVAMVDIDDVAAAVTACALDMPAGNPMHELTGDVAVRFGDVATMLSEALGHKVRHIAPPLWIAHLVLRRSIDAYGAANLRFLFSSLESGREAMPVADLGALLGRPPGTLAEFLARESAGFAT